MELMVISGIAFEVIRVRPLRLHIYGDDKDMFLANIRMGERHPVCESGRTPRVILITSISIVRSPEEYIEVRYRHYA